MSPARRLLVRATAGSGKTHVLTLRIQRRIADGEVAPDQVLAMTFTRKAGDELRKRLLRAGMRDVRAGTFHRARAAPRHALPRGPPPQAPRPRDRTAVAWSPPWPPSCARAATSSSRTGSCRGSSRRSAGRSARASTARPTRRAREASAATRRCRRRSSPTCSTATSGSARAAACSTSTSCSARRSRCCATTPTVRASFRHHDRVDLRRRDPGHEPAAVHAAAPDGGRRPRPVLRGRPQPVDLRLQRREPVS